MIGRLCDEKQKILMNGTTHERHSFCVMLLRVDSTLMTSNAASVGLIAIEVFEYEG